MGREHPDAPAVEDVFELQGALRPVRFSGRLIAHESTERSYTHRWITLDLYQKTSGAGGYVLHTVGWSVVYHRADGCSKGKFVRLPELLAALSDAEPCTDCEPQPIAAISELVAHDPGNTDSVRLEQPIFEVVEAADVESLLRQMEFVPKRGRSGKRAISRPGMNLLDTAEQHDSDIHDFRTRVQDI